MGFSYYSFYSKYCFSFSSGVIYDEDERRDEKVEDFERICRAIKRELDVIQDDEGRRKFVAESSVIGRPTKTRGEYKIYKFYVREVRYSYQDATEMIDKVERNIIGERGFIYDDENDERDMGDDYEE